MVDPVANPPSLAPKTVARQGLFLIVPPPVCAAGPSRVDEVVNAITAVARTGRMGDGKTFVVPAAAVDG